MKITASRRDDILREKEEYEAEKARRQRQHDEEKALYYRAQEDVSDLIKSRVTDALGNTDPVDVAINVGSRWHSHSDSESWEVSVTGNDRDHFAENVALSWNWAVWIDGEGNVQKSSGSWSGLKAVTAEQIDDLKASVRIIETLNNLDWKQILKAPMPKVDNYLDAENTAELWKMTRNFDKELRDLAIEESIGQPVLFKVNKLETQGYYRSGYGYIQILKKSDKFFTIKYELDTYVERPEYRRDGWTVEKLFENAYTERKSIDAVLKSLVKPVEPIPMSSFDKEAE